MTLKNFWQHNDSNEQVPLDPCLCSDTVFTPSNTLCK